DAPRFAFSVPSANAAEPHARYHWRVLPQGMKNSPTICQWFVAKALSAVRTQVPQVMIYHYMDDILIAAPTQKQAEEAQKLTTCAIQGAGLCVAPEKIRKTSPWQYLGWRIESQSFVPQKVKLTMHIKTLNDLQKLLGAINWVRTFLGISAAELHPLFQLLKGDPDLASPRHLTPATQEALQKVSAALTEQQSHCRLEEVPIDLFVINVEFQPYGVLAQWDPRQKDPLVICEWLFLPHQFSKTLTTKVEMIALLVQKGRHRLLEIDACDPLIIYLPFSTDTLNWLMQTSVSLQVALADFKGQICTHYPAHPMLLGASFNIVQSFLQSNVPIPGAPTYFTDGSGKTSKSVIVWRSAQVSGSPQIVELAAVVCVFLWFPHAFNTITDSGYVTGIVQRIEGAFIKDVSNVELYDLLKRLKYCIDHHSASCFITHIRSHSGLPGP
ncbi:PO113 protein, partial [Sapayoa aenigma]|nr:PO113 protein [Sapayoa aenigma]